MGQLLGGLPGLETHAGSSSSVSPTCSDVDTVRQTLVLGREGKEAVAEKVWDSSWNMQPLIFSALYILQESWHSCSPLLTSLLLSYG